MIFSTSSCAICCIICFIEIIPFVYVFGKSILPLRNRSLFYFFETPQLFYTILVFKTKFHYIKSGGSCSIITIRAAPPALLQSCIRSCRCRNILPGDHDPLLFISCVYFFCEACFLPNTATAAIPSTLTASSAIQIPG